MSSTLESSNQVLAFLRRRWPSLLASAGLAAVVALVVAEKFAVQTYTCTGTMLYNRSGAGAPQYQQPELQSIVGLAKSQPVLEAAARKLPDHPPAGALAGGLQTEAVMGSSTLQFTMRGPEAEQTRLTLDAIMQSLIEQAGALRKQTVTNILASQEHHAAKAAGAVETAAENLRKFNAAHQIVLSVDDDLERVRDDIAAVETALETQRSARSSPEEQLQRRRNILQEQQEAERTQLEREAALLLKKNELERAERLHAKRYISDAEFNRIETEYKTLEAQNTAAFEHRRQRLKQLGEALSAHLNRPANDATNAEDEVDAAATARIQAFLTQRRAEVDRLNALRAQADELRHAVVAAQAEVQRTAAQVASFQELAESEYHDLVVVQRAAPSFDAVTSNKKKLLVGAGVVVFLGCLIPVYLLDLLARRGEEATSNDVIYEQLPQIEAPEGRDAGNRDELVRMLALRIQQSAHAEGSVALFTTVDEGVSAAELVVETAKCLAMRGEAVLVIETDREAKDRAGLAAELATKPNVGTEQAVLDDWTGANRTFDPLQPITTKHAPSGARDGLADLLRNGDLVASDVVRPASQFDLLLAGETSLPAEAFASRRLSELLGELRHRYSTILILGPGVDHAVDLEMLAARATSMVFVAEQGGRPHPVALKTIDALKSVSAPILGLVAV